MRKLFLVFLLAVGFSMQGICMNEEVQKRKHKKIDLKHLTITTRSHIDIDSFVQVYVDANFLIVSCLVPPRDENVFVQISDPQGDVVYVANYKVNETQVIYIPIGDMDEENGEYLLEISSENGYLYGCF